MLELFPWERHYGWLIFNPEDMLINSPLYLYHIRRSSHTVVIPLHLLQLKLKMLDRFFENGMREKLGFITFTT